jgi:OmpA-OmpF porin, OOP family
MRPLLLFVVAPLSLCGVAQNVVPNPGFEDLLQCPDWQSQLDRTAFWSDPSEQGTPDFYHACGAAWYSVPDNTVGYQDPVDGQAYAGIFLWIYLMEEWREYLQVELTDTLKPGHCYHFSAHANLGDFSQKTTDALGVRFTENAFALPDPYPPGDVPDIALQPGTFINKADWTLFEGDYVASGTERFLMIGNYKSDAQTTLVLDTGGTGNFVYCYIDLVSLVPCGTTTNSIEENVVSIIDGPTLFSDQLRIRMPHAGSTFVVSDMNGREMIAGRAGQPYVDTSAWPAGVYIVELRSSNARPIRTKVVKQ